MSAHCPKALRLFALLIYVTSVVAAERVALLPFVDPNSTELGRVMLEQFARERLTKRGFEVVGADSVNSVLRHLRVRNTATPIESEVNAIGDSLNAQYVLTGTIHSFSLDSTFSEVSVCARLLRAESSKIVWDNCVSLSGGGEEALISKPVHDSYRKMAKSAAKRLFATLRLKAKPQRTYVSELMVAGREKNELIACSPIAVIPPVDESEVAFSGEMVGDFLVTSFVRRGFNVIDPGRVRNVMLQCEDLRHGQSVNAVSKMLADSLGVRLVVTGTISKLTDARSVLLGSTPEASAELRMIDPRRNIVVWASHVERSGDSRKGLFETGVVHSPAVLTLEMIDDAVAGLRVVRRKPDQPLN